MNKKFIRIFLICLHTRRFVQQSVHNSINLKILSETEIDLSDQE
jgi:hypothetical protein